MTRAWCRAAGQADGSAVGAKTFDGWETYWPTRSNFWPNVMTATKYIASNTDSGDWQPNVFLNGGIAKVREIKRTAPILT